jgi:hypothetical protein
MILSVGLWPLQAHRIREEVIDLGELTITKELTKAVEAYPDAQNQAHVQAALKLRAIGYCSHNITANICHVQHFKFAAFAVCVCVCWQTKPQGWRPH